MSGQGPLGGCSEGCLRVVVLVVAAVVLVAAVVAGCAPVDGECGGELDCGEVDR